MAATGKRRWRRTEHTSPHPDWLQPLPQGPVVFDHSRCAVARPLHEATDERRSPAHRTAA